MKHLNIKSDLPNLKRVKNLRVLITDPIDEEGIALIKKVGEVDYLPNIPRSDLIEKIKDYDILVVRSGTNVDEEVINSGTRLKMIARVGVGVDNVDVDAATRRGIVVINSPDASSISVAEHSFGLMLALARKIVQSNISLKEGKWDRKKFMGTELHGKTLGIIGLGRIGSQVAIRAKAFGMKVIAYDPYISEAAIKEMDVKLVDLETLLKTSDVISIHVPLTNSTRDMIDEKELKMMKNTALLINCARGGIVNEKALYKALKEGWIAGAALDVFSTEPPRDNPLLTLENLISTPHLGASTEEAQKSAAVEIGNEIINFTNNKPLHNVVNMPVMDPETLKRLEPYIPLSEKLGRLAIQLIKGRLVEVNATYCGELSKIDQLALLTSSCLKGILNQIIMEPVNVINAPVISKKRGIKVVEGKTEVANGFKALIRLNLRTEEGNSIEVAGTRDIRGMEKLLEIDGYSMDIPLEGILLFVKIEDRPGMIGRVGTILGSHAINIAAMQVGRKEKGGIMLMANVLDHDVTKEVLAVLESADGIIEATPARI